MQRGYPPCIAGETGVEATPFSVVLLMQA